MLPFFNKINTGNVARVVVGGLEVGIQISANVAITGLCQVPDSGRKAVLIHCCCDCEHLATITAPVGPAVCFVLTAVCPRVTVRLLAQ